MTQMQDPTAMHANPTYVAAFRGLSPRTRLTPTENINVNEFANGTYIVHSRQQGHYPISHAEQSVALVT